MCFHATTFLEAVRFRMTHCGSAMNYSMTNVMAVAEERRSASRSRAVCSVTAAGEHHHSSLLTPLKLTLFLEVVRPVHMYHTYDTRSIGLYERCAWMVLE